MGFLTDLGRTNTLANQTNALSSMALNLRHSQIQEQNTAFSQNLATLQNNREQAASDQAVRMNDFKLAAMKKENDRLSTEEPVDAILSHVSQYPSAQKYLYDLAAGQGAIRKNAAGVEVISTGAKEAIYKQIQEEPNISLTADIHASNDVRNQMSTLQQQLNSGELKGKDLETAQTNLQQLTEQSKAIAASIGQLEEHVKKGFKPEQTMSGLEAQKAKEENLSYEDIQKAKQSVNKPNVVLKKDEAGNPSQNSHVWAYDPETNDWTKYVGPAGAKTANATGQQPLMGRGYNQVDIKNGDVKTIPIDQLRGEPDRYISANDPRVRGYATSLSFLQKQADATERGSLQLHAISGQLVEAAKSLDNGDFKAINNLKQGIANQLNNPELATFEIYDLATGKEWMKLVTGSVASISELSVEAQREVKDKIDRSRNFESIAASVKAMQNEADLTNKSFKDQIKVMKERFIGEMQKGTKYENKSGQQTKQEAQPDESANKLEHYKGLFEGEGYTKQQMIDMIQKNAAELQKDGVDPNVLKRYINRNVK